MFEYTGSRIAFSIFGVDVYWYGVLIVTGMMLATYLSSKELKRIGEDEELMYDVAMWILPAAIIGARLYYVIFEFKNFNSLFDIINVRDGGLAIHGGIIASIIVGSLFLKKRKKNFFMISDIIAIFLPLAQAIGRWGNFINNEAYGAPTNVPWALIIDGQKYHPTFFYESVGNTIIFLVLWYIFRKNPKRGTTTSLYLIGYGIIRFFIEGLRTDSLYFGPIRVAQLVSLIFVLGGIVLFALSKKEKLGK